MPIQPNLLERTAFYTLNQAPSVMLDLAGAMAYQTVSTAIRLGVFQALAKKPLSAAELAGELNTVEEGTTYLLEALATTGYVERKNGRFANSAATEKWLLDDEVVNTNSLLNFWDAALRDLWRHSAEILRSGERPFNFYEWVEASPELGDSFQQTLVMNANNAGPDIARIIQLPDRETRLLDVGGGHGMFSIIMCQENPRLAATILDSHTALFTAEHYIQKKGLAERIGLLEGDLWQVDWGQGYDLVFLFNLLHHYDLESNVRLLKLAAAALKPGGRVAILDQVAGKVMGSATSAVVRLIALQYYLFAGGRVFSSEELTEILSAANFQDPSFHTLRKTPGTSLVVASFPG